MNYRRVAKDPCGTLEIQKILPVFFQYKSVWFLNEETLQVGSLKTTP